MIEVIAFVGVAGFAFLGGGITGYSMGLRTIRGFARAMRATESAVNNHGREGLDSRSAAGVLEH